MDKPNPYNYNNDDHYYNYNELNNNNNQYINSYNNTNLNDNKDFVQFIAVLLLFISCSRGCFELCIILKNKINSCIKKNNLKCKRLNSNDENLLNQCSICLEEFQKKEKIIELNCKHSFHESCIKSWMDANQTESQKCPNCREFIL